MNHSYNITAFGAIHANSNTNPLVELYCALVVLELRLKDHIYATHQRWEQGHKVVEWLATLGETALSLQLNNKLGCLFCTSINGQETVVDPNKFPDIRYIRHESDYPGKASDAQLQAALTTIHQISQHLKTRGI